MDAVGVKRLEDGEGGEGYEKGENEVVLKEHQLILSNSYRFEIGLIVVERFIEPSEGVKNSDL
jgi:hypothetical protein